MAAVLGAVFAAAQTAQGMRPFGVAYAAAAGHPLYAAVGGFLSYLLTGSGGLVFGAAVLVVLSCRMVLEGTAAGHSRSFFPLCAALSLGFTKGVVVLSGGVRAVGLLLCEMLLCFGFAMMLREARDSRSPLQLWGKLTALLGGLLALLPLQLWSLLSPARLMGIFTVLAAGTFGGGAVGACVGAAFGGALDVAQARQPLLLITWCMAGLAAGLGGKRERLPAVLCGCAACGLTSLWLYDAPGVRQGLMECFLAAALLVLLPALCLPLSHTLKTYHEELGSQLLQAGQFFAQGNESGGEALLENAFRLWEEKRQFTAAFIHHAPLDAIDFDFAAARAADSNAMAAQCAQLAEQIFAIAASNELNWWDVL
jgi:hypothetical protein